MKLEFWNNWKGCSLKPGHAFPFTLIDIYGDFNPSYRFFIFTLLNFSIVLDFKSKSR